MSHKIHFFLVWKSSTYTYRLKQSFTRYLLSLYTLIYAILCSVRLFIFFLMLIGTHLTDFKIHLMVCDLQFENIILNSGKLFFWRAVEYLRVGLGQKRIVTIWGGMKENSHGNLHGLLRKVWPPSGKGMSSGLSKMREIHKLPLLGTWPNCPTFFTQLYLFLETVLPAKGHDLRIWAASEQHLHLPPVFAFSEVQASQAFL